MDDTDLLNDLIARNGGTLTLDRGREYLCESSVHIRGKVGFTLDLNGATIRRTKRAKTRAVNQLHIVNSVNVAVRNGHIEGRKDPAQGYLKAVEGHHGIGIHGTTNYLILDLTIDHVPGDFIYIASIGGSGGPNKKLPKPSSNGVLRNLQCNDAGRHPISATGCSGLQIDAGRYTNWHGHSRTGWIDRESRVWGDVQEGITVDDVFYAKKAP